ncbi:MAG: hypothetical protein K6G90_01475 [Clostridia bacterium]|nr:hypothetical protein [Clostridia bacterium]
MNKTEEKIRTIEESIAALKESIERLEEIRSISLENVYDSSAYECDESDDCDEVEYNVRRTRQKTHLERVNDIYSSKIRMREGQIARLKKKKAKLLEKSR